MIKPFDKLRVSVTENAKGGQGAFINYHIMEKDELYGKGRYYALCRLAPSCSVGLHTHSGEMEICHFVSGTGMVKTRDTAIAVHPGDTNVVEDGEEHEVINTGDEDLVYTALILYH